LSKDEVDPVTGFRDDFDALCFNIKDGDLKTARRLFENGIFQNYLTNHVKEYPVKTSAIYSKLLFNILKKYG
jgi:hypothetical protein